MAACCEIVAHSANDMFLKHEYLIVDLGFSHPVFVDWEFLSDCLVTAYLYLSLGGILYSNYEKFLHVSHQFGKPL